MNLSAGSGLAEVITLMIKKGLGVKSLLESAD
jgi:hypothetical protein